MVNIAPKRLPTRRAGQAEQTAQGLAEAGVGELEIPIAHECSIDALGPVDQVPAGWRTRDSGTSLSQRIKNRVSQFPASVNKCFLFSDLVARPESLAASARPATSGALPD